MIRLLTAVLLFASFHAVAQGLHEFRNGEVADAIKINENFSSLDGRLATVESESGSNGWSPTVEDYTYSFKHVDAGRQRITVHGATYDVTVFDVLSYLDHRLVSIKTPIAVEYRDVSQDRFYSDLSISTSEYRGRYEVPHTHEISGKPAHIYVAVGSSFRVSNNDNSAITPEEWASAGEITRVSVDTNSSERSGQVVIFKGSDSLYCNEYGEQRAVQLIPVTSVSCNVQKEIATNAWLNTTSCADPDAIYDAAAPAIEACETEGVLRLKFSSVITYIDVYANIRIDERTLLNLRFNARNVPTPFQGDFGCEDECGDVPRFERNFTPYADEQAILPQRDFREQVIDDLLTLFDYVVISDSVQEREN